MSEHDQQVAVIDYCEAQGIPVFAIPNGGYRGLFIEMKDVNGRKPRESQMQWLDALNASGCRDLSRV